MPLITFECPPFKQKHQGCGDIEDGNVDPVGGLSENSIVGVKQYWDQQKSQQNPRQFNTPVVLLIPEKQTLNHSKEKQGPE